MLRLLWAMLPLVAFYAVESWYGLRAAIASAIAIGLIDVLVGRLRDGRVSRLTLGTTGLVVVLGALSLASDDERFMLWTPVIGDLVFAGVLIGGLALPESLMELAVREQDPTVELDPELRSILRGLTVRLAAVLGVHALVCAWSTGMSRETWLFVSGPVQYALFGAWLAAEFVVARFGRAPR